MKNTTAQDLAIKTIDRNIAVNAGAGTGKTKVLTDRYINILENGCLERGREIESVVAITFTKKASQEMKERIRKNINKKIQEDKKWIRLYNDMEKANISTIHSFCAKILRENPIDANIDPNFQVLEGSKGDYILENTIEDLIIDEIEANNGAYNLMLLFKNNTIDKIVNEFKGIYKKVRGLGLDFKELKDITLNNINSYTLDYSLIEEIKTNAKTLLSISRKNSKLYKFSIEENWQAFINDKLKEEDLLDFIFKLGENLGASKMEDQINLREKITKAIKTISLAKEKDYLEYYEIILDLLENIDRKYFKKKEKERSLDYDDLQILVSNLFDKKHIVEKYQNKYRYIMIDEFQDTNELQKNIFYKLSSRDNKLDIGNLFIVGDPKQAIYGFRGADVSVFHDVVEDIKGKTIYLQKNFRTIDTIIEFVNSLFSNVIDDYTALEYFKKSDNKVDVDILENNDIPRPKDISNADFNYYIESRLIASRIKELVSSNKYSYKDFAILFRSSNDEYIYEQALIDYGIPFYNNGGRGFYKKQEIIDIINLLKSISNRYDFISIAGFLRGPMIGVSDNGIYHLLRNRKNYIFENLDELSQYLNSQDLDKLLIGKEIIEEGIKKKSLYSIYEIVSSIINKTHYIDVLLSKQGGKQLVANVYKFLEIIREYGTKTIGSLEDFIDDIDTKDDRDEFEAKIESESADVVKIMTIHKSKGLEFPVVIIPQLAKGSPPGKEDIFVDKNIGLGFRFAGNGSLYNMINESKNKDIEIENKNILYVALTRAEKLLILGYQGESGKNFKKFIEPYIKGLNVNYINKIVDYIEEDTSQVKEDLNIDDFPLIRQFDEFNKNYFNSFSVSQFLDFRDCKRRFYMNYYKKLPYDNFNYTWDSGSIIDPSKRGIIVHKFCEVYRHGLDEDKLIGEIIRSYGLVASEGLQKEIKKYTSNYVKFHREDYDTVYNEKDFYQWVGNNYIKGIIDRIHIKNNKAEILDFKTNNVKNIDYLKNLYRPQLQLYAYVFEKISKIKVGKASILFLESGERVDIDIDKESLEKNFNEIVDFVNFVKYKSDINHYEKSTKCKEYCSYNNICNLL